MPKNIERSKNVLSTVDFGAESFDQKRVECLAKDPMSMTIKKPSSNDSLLVRKSFHITWIIHSFIR
jgi:hypothetical protein